jgi:hypothetical protein
MLIWVVSRMRREEDGGVLVLVAVVLPVLVLFAGLVIDVGNWFEHKRHLQLQVDAGALAAAQEFRYPCADAPIQAVANDYTLTKNPQVGSTWHSPSVHVLINSPTYYSQSKTDPDKNTGSPCADLAVDVKGTETDVPPLLKITGIVPFINAHARVEIRQANVLANVIPVAVPDPNPQAIKITFVNESTSAVLATTTLTKVGVINGYTQWSNAGSPLPVTFGSADKNVGMNVAVSGSKTDTTCGDPLVDCFNGVEYVRGWSQVPTVTSATDAPQARSVTLTTGSCGDPYFDVVTAACTVDVHANVAFNSSAGGPSKEKVLADIGNATLTLTSAGGGVWQTTGGAVSVPADAGQVPIHLHWEQTAGTVGTQDCSKKKCTGDFEGAGSTQQRVFSGSDTRSGPIRLIQISENGVFPQNSQERCSTLQSQCTHNFVVTMGLLPNLQDATSVNDKPVALRVVGSQNQALDCDPATPNLETELAQGCAPSYKINTGTACPDSPTALWATSQPWPCVATQTGGAVGQIGRGLNTRVYGSPTGSCSATNGPNNWSSFPNFATGDRRIVEMVETPYGTFSGSGNTTFPVTNFAAFYLTGWYGDNCKTDDPAPTGYIVGHFIQYINVLNNGDTGQPCDFNTFGVCTAVLTR